MTVCLDFIRIAIITIVPNSFSVIFYVSRHTHNFTLVYYHTLALSKMSLNGEEVEFWWAR